MSNFKPSIFVITEESRRAYRNDYANKLRESLHINFPTYRELKKQLLKYVNDSVDNEVTVSRSRRGEWGEYFEKWSLINDKLTCTKKGWM